MSSNTRRSGNHRPSNRIVATAVLILALVLGSIGIAAAAPVSATSCQTTWGSLQKSAGGSTGGHLTGVRTGRHTCFDRLVVDLDGPRAGYQVQYVDSLAADASGEIVPVKGGAILQIIARAPAYDDNGSATVDPAAVSATNVAGYRTFRDIEWAGSFEGQTTIGLGVRARLPFRVFALNGPGHGSRLVIDVAHSWQAAAPTDPGSPVGAGQRLAVMGVAHDDVLNIRSAAGVTNRVVATAASTDEVIATGRTRMLSRSMWYQVTLDGTTGWASARYLGIPGSVDDISAAYLADHPDRAATSMSDLGRQVAFDFVSGESGSRVVMSVGPTAGDLGEVTFDVIGRGDDSIAGLRLHIFAEPHDSGDGFQLRTIEVTHFCSRGFDGTSCV